MLDKMRERRISNGTPDERRLCEWIREVEQHYPDRKVDPRTQLAYLVEGLIWQSPEIVVQFLRKNKDNGIQSLPVIRSLMDLLARQLLSKNATEQVEEVIQLGDKWDVPLDGNILQELAKIYQQENKLGKAREIVSFILKKEPLNPEVLRTLYSLAKAEGQFSNAHDLLNRLIEADPSFATVAFAYRERSGLHPDNGRSVRIALLSSYVLDHLTAYLDFECRKTGLTPDFYVAPFNQYTQEILVPSSGLYRFKPDIAFLALAIEDLFPEITGYPSVEELEEAGTKVRDQVLMLVKEFREQCGALIVAHEFALTHRSPHGILDNRNLNGLVRWVEDLNRALADDFRSRDSVYLLPLNQVLGWIGKERGSNPKLRYMASMRLGEVALRGLAKYSMRYLKPLKGLTRKCIVVDLDGTLWGGIVGELGREGVHLGPTAPGQEYMDFQQALLNLTRRGILLAVCSKNNPEDALDVIRNHKHMVLREEHFSAMRINWHNKADNIRELAEELNIGLDSMVFMDDSPIERELIRQVLPEVLTVELPTDPSRYRMTLEELSDFELLAITKEDETRVAQYQAIRKRESVRTSSATLEEYLRSLEITTEITLATPDVLHRLVQMFNKTNQLNLTTRRYQTSEIASCLNSDEHLVYTLQVCDRFGDHGLVGAAIIHGQNDYWRIDSFLMSCRVMGLGVETAFLERFHHDAREAGIRILIGEFIPTKRNQPAKDLYSRHGFNLVKESDGAQFWEHDVTVSKIAKPDWITTTGISRRYDSRTNYQQSIQH